MTKVTKEPQWIKGIYLGQSFYHDVVYSEILQWAHANAKVAEQRGWRITNLKVSAHEEDAPDLPTTKFCQLEGEHLETKEEVEARLARQDSPVKDETALLGNWHE